LLLIFANSLQSRSRSKDQRRAASKKGHPARRCASNPICEKSSTSCAPSCAPSSNHPAQTASPLPQASSPSAGQSTSNLNGEIYIADGDYIKDIEVNDLRNRYTLTKGSTQKMVNILAICRLISSGVTTFFPSLYMYTCVVVTEAYRSPLTAFLANTNFASADLKRVTFRSKKKLALVR
jgi:hypothetical protein